MAMAINLSDYVKRLDVGARERYLEKISIVAEDPYLVKDSPKEFPDLPPVDYTDVAYYLIYTTSYLTGKQLKARKSLDSYNNFLNGWVLETVCKRYKEKEIYLLMGMVCLVVILYIFNQLPKVSPSFSYKNSTHALKMLAFKKLVFLIFSRSL